jgi:hypothetical protein
MTITLDWNAIRPLNGSRATGFEELCAQLARIESPIGSNFIRKGTPDAGVECYTVLSDGSEWGWQAKYIDSLGETQWPQLDKSVKTALEKHPKLFKYFICAPIDRSDARISEQRSAMQRWDAHVAKWTGWAEKSEIEIEFVWWGSHELLERLSHSQHVGRVFFWFDVKGFDSDWFYEKLDEAIKTAGPRYTPEIHIDLPIAAELEAFGRTERFFNNIKSLARNIRKNHEDLQTTESEIVHDSLILLFSELSSKIQIILDELGALRVQPTGLLPIKQIECLVLEAEDALKKLTNLRFEREYEQDEENRKKEKQDLRQNNPNRHFQQYQSKLYSALTEAQEEIRHSDIVSGNSLMILKGAAGTGKTHLFCDIAKQRIAANKPTVLLMGQRFVSEEHPWIQAANQLDLHDLSEEQFVGALEAAAQAANCRAIVMVDAINEGKGRMIWPDHLSAFLVYLERSPWISVLLSVRSSYEERVLPKEVSARAFQLTHPGFADHEYDATKTFFLHYGLEFPSTPLLTPEFRNPLFLKTLCIGLSGTDTHRIPRGFNGITSIFKRYFSAINETLSKKLGYNPKQLLVTQALEVFAKAIAESGDRWLTLTKAEETINALLPGREFESSLYHGLVSEGILVEEVEWSENKSTQEEVVFIGYERFADHVIAKALLDAHLENDDPQKAFTTGGPLAFIFDDLVYVENGLLEALCIQLPERIDRELIDLAPNPLNFLFNIGEAFLQSLIWRDVNAFSKRTLDIVNTFIKDDGDFNETLNVFLTVATIPDHRFNAHTLDQMLKENAMPDRDSWWSTFLHFEWGNHGAVDRLVEWAGSVRPKDRLDDEVIDLCAMTLSWMLTTSNRFLRDHAAKALVSLLTGRLDAVVRLIERFAYVDDPYIAERIYAVAYGVSTRCQDLKQVGLLAECVYNQVFVPEITPADILLRDYARGVVEWAIYLGSKINVQVERIRPPYRSIWPHIPTEKEIQPYLLDNTSSSRNEWAFYMIGASVMSLDFARYIIGTNSASTSRVWLSVMLDDSLWKTIDEQLLDFVSGLTEDARITWSAFEEAERELRNGYSMQFIPNIDKSTEGQVVIKRRVVPRYDDEIVATLQNNRENALQVFKEMLSGKQIEHLDSLLEIKKNNSQNRPGFELRLIQRYVLWRVFNLGWTTERFGDFDSSSIHMSGRDAAKAERIGKKYQWIAYHEILAMIADHYQYYEAYNVDGDRAYDGPWQKSLRDIDPTSIIQSVDQGVNDYTPWLGSVKFKDYGDEIDSESWVNRDGDFPVFDDILRKVNFEDSSRWLTLKGDFNASQEPPADKDLTDVERRSIWYSCTGYLIHSGDADAFVHWTEADELWWTKMPNSPDIYQVFMGEYGWSRASQYVHRPYFGDDGWTQPDQSCPVKVCIMSVHYQGGSNGFDCSGDENVSHWLPSFDLVAALGLRWTGVDAVYVDSDGVVAAVNPTAHSDRSSTLLIREDLLKTFLEYNELSIVWKIHGEKSSIGKGFSPSHYASTTSSELYLYQEGELFRFMHFEPKHRVKKGAVKKK